MNTETGKIEYYTDEELENKLKLLKDSLIEVKEEDMTEKQKEEMQVSKFDNKSKLGQIFTMSRAERRKQNRKGIHFRNL
jgi:hypothetical protein